MLCLQRFGTWSLGTLALATLVALNCGARFGLPDGMLGGVPICNSVGINQGSACPQAQAGCKDTYAQCKPHIAGADTITCCPACGNADCKNPPCVPTNDDTALTPCNQPGP